MEPEVQKKDKKPKDRGEKQQKSMMESSLVIFSLQLMALLRMPLLVFPQPATAMGAEVSAIIRPQTIPSPIFLAPIIALRPVSVCFMLTYLTD